jgi:hypothetical protein
MNNEITIVIIDDDVAKRVIPDLCFDFCCFDGTIQQNDENEISPNSHGSICAAIIRKYAPQAKIGSIRILNGETMCGDVSDLVAAIEWCIEHKVKIIHLSIGSVEAQDIIPLYETISKAQDSIIIAACKNGRNVTFPASFPNVIGVKTDEELLNNQYRLNTYPNGGIEFVASSRHPETPICNSFAAPLITAEVWHCLNENPEYTTAVIKRTLGCQTSCDYFTNELQYFSGYPYEDNYPIIAFSGDNAKEYILQITAMFLKDGYLPLLFSAEHEDFGFFFFENETVFKTCVHGMAEYYGADLLFVLTNETEPYADVVVNCENNIDSVYAQLLQVFSE